MRVLTDMSRGAGSANGPGRRGWIGTPVEGAGPTPTQTHRLGCGYAALETIARGRGLTLESLSDREELARREMSLWDLQGTARRIGLRALAGRVPDRRIEACRMPLIALIRYDQPPPDGAVFHYMVVFDADEREVVMSDPGEGRIKRVDRRTFDGGWAGIAVVF